MPVFTQSSYNQHKAEKHQTKKQNKTKTKNALPLRGGGFPPVASELTLFKNKPRPSWRPFHCQLLFVCLFQTSAKNLSCFILTRADLIGNQEGRRGDGMNIFRPSYKIFPATPKRLRVYRFFSPTWQTKHFFLFVFCNYFSERVNLTGIFLLPCQEIISGSFPPFCVTIPPLVITTSNTLCESFPCVGLAVLERVFQQK